MPDIFISPEKSKTSQTQQKEASKTIDQSGSKPKKLREDFAKLKQHAEDLPGHTHNPLAAYSYLPEKFNFEDKEEKEKVILFLRRHPITNVGWIVITILMILAPLLLASFPLVDFLPLNFRFVAILGWYMITLAFALEKFLTWFFNVSIVTDQRILDIDFVNLIYKQISDTTIDRVQDVTYKMGGVIRTVFNYGDVVVETAGEIPSFNFWAVPNPDRVTKVIEELMVKEDGEGVGH